ncbi:MAG: N-acetyltransferase [Planctomycetota bacterium]
MQSHAGTLAGAPNAWILCVGPAPLVSLPSHVHAAIGAHARRWTLSTVSSPDALAERFLPFEVERVVGPAFIGYGTSSTLDLRTSETACAVSAADLPAVTRLRTACGDEAWAHGGSEVGVVPTFGVRSEHGEIRALAGYRVWGGEIAHLSIVTAPDARGHGFATAAIACAARHAIAAGLLPQYRTLTSNAPSMAIARRLGFLPYGSSVSVRLRSPPPPDTARSA